MIEWIERKRKHWLLQWKQIKPRIKKYGIRYLLSKKYRKWIKNREYRAKYGSTFLANKDKIKAALISRDGTRCQWCFQRKRWNQLTIDHVELAANGRNNKLQNLRLLCFGCHQERNRAIDKGYLKV